MQPPRPAHFGGPQRTELGVIRQVHLERARAGTDRGFAAASAMRSGPTREERVQARLYRIFDSDPARVVGFLRWLASARGLPATPCVLDVGCGPGRLLLPLARLGWPVMGLEVHPGFLALARAAVRDLPGAWVRRGGFGDIEERGAYDLVMAVNGPYSYLRTSAEQRDALRRAWAALRPGGVLFLEVAHLPRLIRWRLAGGARAVCGTGRRAIVQEVSVAVASRNRSVTFDDRYFRGTRLVGSQRHDLRIVTARGLAAQVAAAGFVDLQTHRNYDSRGSDRAHGRHILLSGARPSR
jgi:SAM-dependent methyltransferase